MKKRNESFRDLRVAIHPAARGRLNEETSGHIREHLRKTEDVIKTLRKDLDLYRSQAGELQRERDDLSRLLGQAEYGQRDRDALESEVGFVRAERDRLAEVLEPLQAENERLAEHCRLLEASLAEERRQREQAQQVIVYLEEQIRELEAMVDLLRDHESFLDEDEEETNE